MAGRVGRRKFRRSSMVVGARREYYTTAAQTIAVKTRPLLSRAIEFERVRLCQLTFVTLGALRGQKFRELRGPHNLPPPDALPHRNGHRLSRPRLAPVRAKAPRLRIPLLSPLQPVRQIR